MHLPIVLMEILLAAPTPVTVPAASKISFVVDGKLDEWRDAAAVVLPSKTPVRVWAKSDSGEIGLAFEIRGTTALTPSLRIVLPSLAPVRAVTGTHIMEPLDCRALTGEDEDESPISPEDVAERRSACRAAAAIPKLGARTYRLAERLDARDFALEEGIAPCCKGSSATGSSGANRIYEVWLPWDDLPPTTQTRLDSLDFVLELGRESMPFRVGLSSEWSASPLTKHAVADLRDVVIVPGNQRVCVVVREREYGSAPSLACEHVRVAEQFGPFGVADEIDLVTRPGGPLLYVHVSGEGRLEEAAWVVFPGRLGTRYVANDQRFCRFAADEEPSGCVGAGCGESIDVRLERICVDQGGKVQRERWRGCADFGGSAQAGGFRGWRSWGTEGMVARIGCGDGYFGGDRDSWFDVLLPLKGAPTAKPAKLLPDGGQD